MSGRKHAVVSGDERVPAPFGRRAARITANRASGGYRVFSALDSGGPEPRAGQFYMLSAATGWGTGPAEPGTGPEFLYLPRAFSVAATERLADGIRLDFLLEDIGPGTHRLGALAEGEKLLLTGPLGRPFSRPSELNPQATGAVLVGGGVGVAPLAIWRHELSRAAIPIRVLLGFRNRQHSGGMELFSRGPDKDRLSREAGGGAPESGAKPVLCPEVRLASDDGHVGHHGYVTDLLAVLLEGGDAARSAAVFACGPPAMLEAVRQLCGERGVACELALESPMACGFGACYGCAVPLAAGGFMRLCVDGPVVRGEEIETAMVAGAGHG